MIWTTSCDQGRARGLYDEQLQRQQQEKRLAKEAPAENSAMALDEAPRLPRPRPKRRGLFFQLRLDREQDDIDFASDL